MTKKNTNMNISATAPISRFNIILGDERQNLRNIGEEWTIDIMPPQRGRFFGSFGLKVQRDLNLVLRIKELPDDLEFANINLFKLRVLGENYNSTGLKGDVISVPLTLTELKTRFQLFFNPSAVKDSKKAQNDSNREYQIIIELAVVNRETNMDIYHTEDEIIEFALAEVHSRPQISITIDKKWKRFLYKKDLGKVMIGNIHIDNPSKLKYYPSIDLQAKFSSFLNEKSVDSNIIQLDLGDKIYGNDSFCNISPNQFTIEEYESTVLYPNRASVIEIPIVADVKRIGNPYEAKSRTYDIELEVTYHHHDAVITDIVKAKESITIDQDAQKAELHVFSRENELLDGGIQTLERTEFVYDSNCPYYRHPLTIKNTADSGLPHAGLIIGHFQYTVSFEEDNVIEDYVGGKEREEVFHFIESDGGHLLKTIIEKYHQIESKPGDDIELNLIFTGRDIKRLFHIANEKKNYETTVLVKFSFDYWLNDGGYDIERATRSGSNLFSATLRLPVFQKPCDKWLGIDFGTSAIVSMYDNETLDLRGQKTQLFQDDDPHYENGTMFLSSNTVFRTNAVASNTSQLLTENNNLPDFHSLAVCLSPTWQIERQNHRFVLPCLKLMVGYEILPQLESFPNEQFTYFTGRGATRQSNKLIDEEHIPTRLAYVDNIFAEVYSELFQYYIRECLPQDVPNEKINRLVLTIPNTFSPRHIETIRSIVKQSLNRLDIRDICFVSESDAVACYYLKYRHEINKHLNRSTEDIYACENILVYDMGAGTLDLSLFTLEPDKNGTRKVTVLGKIGLSKAGNYLDYVLANILVDNARKSANEANDMLMKNEDVLNKIKDNMYDILSRLKDVENTDKKESEKLKNIADELAAKEKELATECKVLKGEEETQRETAEKLNAYVNNVSTDVLDSSRALKNFIKEELKPALSMGDSEVSLKSATYTELGLTGDIEISISDILEHERFKEFINDCAEQLINNFFRFLHLPNSFRLDTVIVSGRSSKLLHIREALNETLAPYKNSETFRIFNTSEGTNDASKTSVVEGAMKYAKELYSSEPTITFSENSITPCYGVIYKDQDRKEFYQELFNPRTANYIVKEVDGKRVTTYKTDNVVLDLRHTDDLLLIQSYSGDTENDWNAGKMDYISIVQTYSTAHLGRLQNAQLHIEVDTQNMIKLVVNNTVTDDYSPNRIDLTKSSIGDSLWPRVQEIDN